MSVVHVRYYSSLHFKRDSVTALREVTTSLYTLSKLPFRIILPVIVE